MTKYSRNSGKNLPITERRKRGFSITLSDAERKNYREKAKLAGMDLATYMRSCADQREIKVIYVPEPSQKLVADLSHTMVNLNTLARSINSPDKKPAYDTINTAVLKFQFALIGMNFFEQSEAADG